MRCRESYPVDALIDEFWKLGLALEVAEDAASDPTAVEELHRVQWHHLGRRMDPQHHRQAPALHTIRHVFFSIQNSETAIIRRGHNSLQAS